MKIAYTNLSEICDYKYGDKIEPTKDGMYKIYGDGSIYTDKYNRQEKTLIISCTNVNKHCVFVTNENIFLNDVSLELIIKNDSFMFDYIAYYLYLNQNIVFECVDVNNLMDMKKLMGLQIQHINIDTQKEIVNYLDNVYKNVDINDTNTYMYPFAVFNLMLNNDYDIFDKIIQYQNILKHLHEDINSIPQQKVLAITSIFDKYRFQSINTSLNTLCSTKIGSSIKKVSIGKYLIIDNNIPPINYHSKTNCNGVDKFFMTSDGNVLFCDNDCYLSDVAIVITPKNIQKKYLYYYLKYNLTLIKSYFTSTDLNKNIKNLCDNLMIPLPSTQIQQQIIIQIEGILYGRSVFDKYIESLQEQISNINTIVTNIVKTSNLLSITNIGSITDTFEYGTSITNIDRYARTHLNIIIPYSTQYGIMWCDKSTYSGMYIIFNTVNLTNCYIVNGIFSASSDMIVIGLKPEYQEYIEIVWNQIKNNFNANKEGIFMQLQNFTVELYSK